MKKQTLSENVWSSVHTSTHACAQKMGNCYSDGRKMKILQIYNIVENIFLYNLSRITYEEFPGVYTQKTGFPIKTEKSVHAKEPP